MTISGIGGGASFAQAQQRFERADANGNGTLNREEFDSAAKNAPGNLIKGGDDAFAKLDANGDGELTKGEIRDGVRAVLEASGGRPGAGFLLDRMIGCPILLTEDPVAKCKQGRRMAQRTHLSFLESG